MLGDSILLAFVLFLIRFVAVEASYQWAGRTRAGLRYPVGLGLRILFRAGGPLLIFVGYKMSEQASTRFDLVAASAIALMGLACILSEPGEIITSALGVAQKSHLGLRSRNIAWEGATARYVPALREVLVIGRDGTAITHSKYHVGQEQFLHEFERHGVAVQS